MVESLENKVMDHQQQVKQSDSVWNVVFAAVLLVGISVSAAYMAHEFFCSSCYSQIQQDVHSYFYRGYNVR